MQENDSNNLSKTSDKKIVLSLQEVFTYSFFLITIGASIYTAFQALPKIDKLNEVVQHLEIDNAHVEERILNLTNALGLKRQSLEILKP